MYNRPRDLELTLPQRNTRLSTLLKKRQKIEDFQLTITI